MSKYSEVIALCDDLAAEAHQPSLREAFKVAAAALRELEAESVRLSVIDGTSCREEQEAGNGPCGCCVICLRARVAELEAERDRLREALGEIVNCTPANQPDKWPHHHHYLFVARAALEGKG